jgi:hypothetical protein
MVDHDADREGVELEYETLLEVYTEARQCADCGLRLDLGVRPAALQTTF